MLFTFCLLTNRSQGNNVMFHVSETRRKDEVGRHHTSAHTLQWLPVTLRVAAQGFSVAAKPTKSVLAAHSIILDGSCRCLTYIMATRLFYLLPKQSCRSVRAGGWVHPALSTGPSMWENSRNTDGGERENKTGPVGGGRGCCCFVEKF